MPNAIENSPPNDQPSAADPPPDRNIGARMMARAVEAMDDQSLHWLNMAAHIGGAIAELEEINCATDSGEDELCVLLNNQLERAFNEARAGCEGFLFEFIRSGGGRFNFREAMHRHAKRLNRIAAACPNQGDSLLA
jgi:hypothetical protein